MRHLLPIIGLAAAICGLAALAGCSSDADTVSTNISTKADYFQVERKITFYNSIVGQPMLVIEGLCSLGNNDPARELSVTCKVGPTDYKKHFLGLSDNVTYMVEQVDAIAADPYHYLVVWKPLSFVPDIRLNQP